jgi:hypothetical protein
MPPTGSSRRRNHQIRRPGETGDGVKEKHHVLAYLHQALCLLQGEVGHPEVFVGRPVESGSDDLAVHGTGHVRHLFRPLVDEEHHEDDVRVVHRDGVGYFLQQGGLSRLGGRHEQRPLSLSYGSEKVHEAG